MYDDDFPLSNSPFTTSVRRVHIYSAQEKFSWFDEMQLILNEASRAVKAVIPSTVKFTNGFWNGTIRPQETGNTILQVYSHQTGPEQFRNGESNPFSVVAGLSFFDLFFLLP